MTPQTNPEIDAIAQRLNLPPAVVGGILGDLASQKETKISSGQLAARWGTSFGALSTCRSMGKITIADIREGSVTKKLCIANVCDDALMDRLSDPMAVAEISAKDLSSIAKQNIDSALNLSNGQVGASPFQINIGDVRVLMDKREQRGAYVPIRERLAKGKVIDVTPDE